MIKQRQELIVIEKRGRTFLIPTAVVASLVLSTSAFAADGAVAPLFLENAKVNSLVA